MEPKFKIEGRIGKAVPEVYEAVADPKMLSRYFTTGGAKGRMERGSTLTWDFADFPGAFDVRVKSAIRNSLIILEWDAAEGGYSTQVEFHFESVDGDRTLVTIEESGWHETDASLKASYKNCEGWTQMLCCMKAWLEYGVVLRKGFYK